MKYVEDEEGVQKHTPRVHYPGVQWRTSCSIITNVLTDRYWMRIFQSHFGLQ